MTTAVNDANLYKLRSFTLYKNGNQSNVLSVYFCVQNCKRWMICEDSGELLCKLKTKESLLWLQSAALNCMKYYISMIYGTKDHIYTWY